MSLTRMLILLGGALLVMVAVVLIRAQTAALHYQRSLLDREAEALQTECRERALELTRRKNPALLRERVQNLWNTTDAASAAD